MCLVKLLLFPIWLPLKLASELAEWDHRRKVRALWRARRGISR